MVSQNLRRLKISSCAYLSEKLLELVFMEVLISENLNSNILHFMNSSLSESKACLNWTSIVETIDSN